MGERANRLKAFPPKVSDLEREAPQERARELVSEIEDIRHRLDETVSELDRRRHEATDLRLQLKRHPAIVVGAGVGLLAVASSFVALALVARRRERPASKARSLRRALGRAYENPHKVARPEPGVAMKVLAAIATTVGTSLAKKYVEQLWSQRRAAAAPDYMYKPPLTRSTSPVT